jgi:peptidyl-prolyl cis-trans isomerase C
MRFPGAPALALAGALLLCSQAPAAEKRAAPPKAKATAAQAKDSAPVAVVNGTPIPRAEVDRVLEGLQQAMAQPGSGNQAPNPSELRSEVLKQLIDRELLYQVSLKFPVKDLEKRSEEELKELKSRAPDAKSFSEELKKNSLTEKELKKYIVKRISVQNYVSTQVVPTIKVTETDAQKFYDENKSKFLAPEQVKASHILIRAPADAKPEDRSKAAAKARDLRAKAAKGEEFAKLARENSEDPGSASQGGDLGFFAKHQMVPSFGQAAFALKPGQVSEVVETPFGYHVIKVAEHKASTQQPFAEVKAQLVTFLERRALDSAVSQRVEELRRTAKITVAP